jgi:hypothetical protein
MHSNLHSPKDLEVAEDLVVLVLEDDIVLLSVSPPV